MHRARADRFGVGHRRRRRRTGRDHCIRTKTGWTQSARPGSPSSTTPRRRRGPGRTVRRASRTLWRGRTFGSRGTMPLSRRNVCTTWRSGAGYGRLLLLSAQTRSVAGSVRIEIVLSRSSSLTTSEAARAWGADARLRAPSMRRGCLRSGAAIAGGSTQPIVWARSRGGGACCVSDRL